MRERDEGERDEGGIDMRDRAGEREILYFSNFLYSVFFSKPESEFLKYKLFDDFFDV